MSLSTRQARYHRTEKGRAVGRAARQRLRAVKRDFLRETALAWGCADCAVKADLHWHHVEPGTKRRNVTSLTGSSWEILLAEVAKCVVLCGLCHRRRHGRSVI